MSDHTYPMRDALSNAMARISGPEDLDDRDDWTLADVVADVDVSTVTDYLIAYGGPTAWFRVWERQGEVQRVEYHDTWAAPIDVIQLTDDEAATVLEMLGHDVRGTDR